MFEKLSDKLERFAKKNGYDSFLTMQMDYGLAPTVQVPRHKPKELFSLLWKEMKRKH